MAKILSEYIEGQRLSGQIKPVYILKINGVNVSDYLLNYSVSFDRSFGSASASFTLFNKDSRFSVGNSAVIQVGDTIEFTEQYHGDTTVFKRFYGLVESRAYNFTSSVQSVSLSCLDYISYLKNWDLNLKQYGSKIEVKEEKLEPVFLTETGKEMFAQIFNFKNNAIAQDPPAILTIRDKGNKTEEMQTEGFDILYAAGQVKFGSPLNARDNYDVYARKYFFYQRGLYVEDIIQEILLAPNGYDGYLFNEASREAVINNHLTTTYLEEEGLDELGNLVNYLVPNSVAENITIYHQLQEEFTSTRLVKTTLLQDFDPATDTILYLDSTTDIEIPSGETEATVVIDGQEYVFTGVESGNTLTGVTGAYAVASDNEVVFDTGEVLTTITLESTSGLPDSGEANINGNIFEWTSKDATHLYGISNLTSKPADSWLKYTVNTEAGQVWYLSYTNLVTDLEDSDFELDGGTFYYFDKKFGRLILDSPISSSANVKCISDYSFYTLQATGIEINGISFTERSTENRFEALKKLFENLAPNYIVMTKGDEKIWAQYLRQKPQQDYNLNLISSLGYMEDSDVYTRVKLWGKNVNPTNIMFNDGVQFTTSDESYSSLASNDTLHFTETKDGWHKYSTLISSAGYITADTFVPQIYINNVKVDNSPHLVASQPVTIKRTTREVTTTTSGKGGSSIETSVYYYYEVQFAHQSIHSSQAILIYDQFGVLKYTLNPNTAGVDYSRGRWVVPGSQENTIIESLSTATYYIFYSGNNIKIDYDNVYFYIKDTMIPEPDRALVTADYEYIHTMTPVNGINRVIDGRWDTQVQTEFFTNPPTGYNYAILDLGQVYQLQAFDIIAGFYKPDEIRKFDIGMRITLQYSKNNIDYYYIGDDITNFELQGGQSKSFEEDELGVDFEARYIKIILDNVEQIPYTEKGTWAVAFTEISAYEDLIISSEAKLIPVAYLSGNISSTDTTIAVDSTKGFVDPDSGEEVTAYIDGNSFTYTGLTSNSFTGCTIGSGESYTTNTLITKSIKNAQDVYDYKNLYHHQGDRLYKQVKISDEFLYTQEQLDRLSKAYLEEFVKEHTKIQAAVLYSPHLQVGQTVRITHLDHNVNENYFIEKIETSDLTCNIVLAKYSD